MHTFMSAVARARKAFLNAVVRSLMHGKSLLRLFFSFLSINPAKDEAVVSPASPASPAPETKQPSRKLQDFLHDVDRLYVGPTRSRDELLAWSSLLRDQFREAMALNAANMLPSYNYQLPSGEECGQYLALDMGGTTLRLALIELKGSESEIVRTSCCYVDKRIQGLEGMDFFHWMADRIIEIMAGGLEFQYSRSRALPIAMAWSFPVEQTSLKGGKIHHMGKGLKAANGLIGRDLGEVLNAACMAKGINVEVEVIINDSTACLLSQSHVHRATRLGLILGTGANVAVFVPVPLIGRFKYGDRPASWWNAARQVIVNTEMGMFGKDVFPLTPWDRSLKEAHERPDFQPLEQLVSGMYLGEIVRYTLIDAIETTGIFGGVVPPSIRVPYGLKTETLAAVESDESLGLEAATKAFLEAHPSPVTPTKVDIEALKTISRAVALRSSAIIATSVYTLWVVRTEAFTEYAESLPAESEAKALMEAEASLGRTVVAFNGSVIEKYPGYLEHCQGFLNQLVASGADGTTRSVDLVEAKHSSLIGAAVALACVHGST